MNWRHASDFKIASPDGTTASTLLSSGHTSSSSLRNAPTSRTRPKPPILGQTRFVQYELNDPKVTWDPFRVNLIDQYVDGLYPLGDLEFGCARRLPGHSLATAFFTRQD
ncbi:MAG: hypothetical protein ACYDC1_13495 [Limisphaerales bacterium]